MPFRDPLNRERRFISLRLDDAPIKSSRSDSLATTFGGRCTHQTVRGMGALPHRGCHPGLQEWAERRIMHAIL